MNQTTVVEQKTLEAILDRLDKLAKEMKYIKERLNESEPPYGSNAWWQWSDAQAIEDIKKRRIKRFKSAEEAVNWLNS